MQIMYLPSKYAKVSWRKKAIYQNGTKPYRIVLVRQKIHLELLEIHYKCGPPTWIKSLKNRNNLYLKKYLATHLDYNIQSAKAL